jgi:hypothetical protein
MDAIGTLRTLRRSGYVVTVERERLRLRGHAKPSEDLYASVVRHRDELIRLVEEEIIVDEREVFGMARAHFGEIAPEHREDPPIPAPEKGRDPLVHEYTDKARFFRGVRRRDLAKREREGLPPHIRLVGKGAA